MKKQFIRSLLMLQITALFISSSCHAPDKQSPGTPGTSCGDCRETETFGHTMEEFLEVTREYRDKRWKLINAQLPAMTNNKDSIDSRAIWFSLDSLKKFICTIDKYSEQLHIKPENLGVRMYYAVYKNDPDYQNLHTIFMVPTVAVNENAVPQDFDPRSSVLDKGEIKARDSLITFVDLANYPNKVALAFSKDATSSGTIKNNGDLCPPKCPTSAANTLNAIDSDLP